MKTNEMRMFIVVGEIATLVFFVFITFMIDIRYRIDLVWSTGGILSSLVFTGPLLVFTSLVGILLCGIAIYKLYRKREYLEGGVINLIGGIAFSIAYICVSVSFVLDLGLTLGEMPPGGTVEGVWLIGSIEWEIVKIVFSLIGLGLLHAFTIGYIILAVRKAQRKGEEKNIENRRREKGKLCSICGSEIKNPSIKFCPNCGNEL
jgi:hypothetical protein